MASFVNPPSLYTGGNAKFDSTPSVNVYAKLLAQRQAKEDAMGEYVRNLNTKITPAGMRVQDIPAFSDMKDKWQRFGIANQRRMANDPRLRASFDAMGQQLINFANESKAEEEAKKPLVGILTDPKKRMELSDEVFPMIAEHDKPLYQQDANGNFVRDYNRKRLDYTHELFNPPDFDFNKNFEGWTKGMSMGKQYEQDATKYRKEPTTGSVFIPFQETYSPEQVKQIGANAENFVKGN